MKIYKVGGCVRDQLLNQKPNDIDYCVEASSYDNMVEYLKIHNFQILNENVKYFAVRAKFPDNNDLIVDFTLCRKDGIYSDHRRPDQVEIGNIYDDLARRDFTINAMAIEESTGILIDPYGGQQDLNRKIIRCVGSAKERLMEDPLRIFRALRFAVTKNFNIDNEIYEIIWNEDTTKIIEKLSFNRIRDELFKMFSYDTIASMKILTSLPIELQKIIFKSIWLEPTSRSITKTKK